MKRLRAIADSTVTFRFHSFQHLAAPALFLALLFLLFGLAACGGGGGGGGNGGVTPPTTIASPVTALYPTNGAGWNDYVKNDAATRYIATDIACGGTETGGYDACIHGGEALTFNSGLTLDCATHTASDELGAFAWVCDDGAATTEFHSSGLADGKLLSDLIDFATPAWKPNRLLINDGTRDTHASQSTVWRDNTLAVDNDGMVAGDFTAGTVYLITADPSALYVIGANKVALVIQPGVTMTGTATAGEFLITANTFNFLWVEGTLDGTGDADGIDWSAVKFSVMRGIVANNSDFNGVYLAASSNNNTLSGISATNNGDYGVYLSTSSNNNTLSGISVDINGSMGVAVLDSSGNTLSGISATNHSSDGVYLSNISNSTISGISAVDNVGTGVVLDASTNNALSNISVTNSGEYGMNIGGSSNNTLSGISAANSAMHGIYLNGSSNNTLSDISAVKNSETGVYLAPSSNNNTLSGISVAYNNDGIALQSSFNNTLSGISAASNVSSGVSLWNSSNNTLSGISTANSVDSGITLWNSSSNTLSGISAANNVFDGIYLGSSTDNTLSGISVVNNGRSGLNIESSSNNTFSGISAANNGAYGVNLLTSSGNTFTGGLKVGNNASGDCYVDAESTSIGGLKDDSTGTGGAGVDATHDGECLQVAPSDFGTATTGVTLAASYVGKVDTDDATNASDTDGGATFPADAAALAAFDWTNFANPYRGWGADGGVFPSLNNRGLFGCDVVDWINQTDCLADGGTWNSAGRIWDWSLANGDTGDGGGPVILGALTPPTGNDTLEHKWVGTAADLAACTAAFPGSTWIAVNDCRSTFLRHAVELQGDGAGNDNLLCETNEACLYRPNMASYQGHGALIGAGNTGTVDTVKNVTLWKYEANGY